MTWRFMAAIVAVVLLALLVQDVPLAGYLRDVEQQRIVTSLERDAFVLAGRSEEALHITTPDADGTITALAQEYRQAGGARVVIVDQTGVAIVTSDDDTAAVGDSFLSRPEIATALGGGIATGTRFSTTLDEQLLYVAVPVFSGDEVLGAVRLTYPDAVVAAAVNQKLFGFGAVGLITVLLAAAIGLVLSRSVTRRLRLLRDATERFARGDTSARADETSGAPELRSVARSFNGMTERLDGVLRQQRAFAADASHQLRTPLTALRLRFERARALVHDDPEGAAERLEAAEAELDRLDQLIEGLLVLSRAEGADAAVATVDVGAAAADRVAQWGALAEESGMRVDLQGPASARVRAVPTAVEQIIDNLVDNALGVTPEGEAVVVRIEVDGERTVLHVLDRGPGLSPTDRERAFERFWRGGGERAGSGIGLAIVAQLARVSGGSAELRERPGGGLDAAITLPTA